MKKKDKKPLPFRKRFGQLFDYLIKRRQPLLDTGRNQKPEAYMRLLVYKFSPYLRYQWTDSGAARFLQLHFLELLTLIPSRETHKRDELETLHTAAEEILQTIKHQEKWQQLSAF